MKLKQLYEERAELLKAIEKENESETRSVEKVNDLLNKLDSKNEEIELEERILNSKKFIKTQKDSNVKDYNAEIRSAISSKTELDVTDFEVEERSMGLPGVSGPAQSIGNITKTTFANAILKKATEISDLYKYVRKENFGSALHQIPVQKTKITEFANVKELAEYAEKNIDFEPIQMAAHKFGNISIISEEALADTGYNLMGELLEQYGESAGLTIDKLLVKGDAATKLQGLNSFFDTAGNAQSGAIKQSVQTANLADVGLDHIMAMYNGLPNKYRQKATWVIGTELAARLTTTVDGIGRPLLYQDFSKVPFGGQATPMLLGQPVVISDHVSNITGAAEHTPIAFFGDLSKALILGMRQNFTIRTSTEYKFITDGIAVKGTMRLDIKRALGEALTALVVTA